MVQHIQDELPPCIGRTKTDYQARRLARGAVAGLWREVPFLAACLRVSEWFVHTFSTFEYLSINITGTGNIYVDGTC